MAYVEVERATSLSPEEAFARITDWEAHRVPLTRIRRTPKGFIARTGLGPVGFDDPMEVTQFEPPHRVEIVKLGRIVRGWASIEVRASTGGATVLWREEVSLPLMPALIERIAGRMMLNHLLNGLIGRGT